MSDGVKTAFVYLISRYIMAGSGTGYREDVVAVSCVTKIEREKGTRRERERERGREGGGESGPVQTTGSERARRRGETLQGVSFVLSPEARTVLLRRAV